MTSTPLDRFAGLAHDVRATMDQHTTIPDSRHRDTDHPTSGYYLELTDRGVVVFYHDSSGGGRSARRIRQRRFAEQVAPILRAVFGDGRVWLVTCRDQFGYRVTPP